MKRSPPSPRTPGRSSSIGGAFVALLTVLVLGACSDLTQSAPTGPEESAERPSTPPGLIAQDFGPAIAAQDRYSAALMRNPNIVGTGVGVNEDGQPSVRLFLMHGQVSGLPSQLDGIPVSSRVTGPFVLRNPQTRARPAPMGYSIGHPDITAGTLGARVVDNSGNVYILSNNHILANSNEASIGDNALQPGPYDGGTEPGDIIGTLADFDTISFTSNNTIDAAIAAVNSDDVSGSTPNDAYGAPSSTTAEASPTMPVQKFGRTTGHTTGTVMETNVTVSICFEPSWPFGCNQAATFVDQISIGDGSFSDGGDSGSLIVTQDGAHPVGLLFAGGDTRTLANPIGAVLDRFNVTIDPTVPGDGGGDPEPVAPTASFTSDCTGLTCDFDASSSAPGDEPISGYAWDFGDGANGSGVSPSHTYGEGGTYTVTLIVTDGTLADTTSQTVTVEAPDDGGDGEVDGDPEIVDFDHSPRSTGPWNRATVQWSVSHPDAALATVTTELLDGNGGVLASSSTNVSGSTASGEHELRTRSTPAAVRITVTDTAGNFDIQTQSYGS